MPESLDVAVSLLGVGLCDDGVGWLGQERAVLSPVPVYSSGTCHTSTAHAVRRSLERAADYVRTYYHKQDWRKFRQLASE